MPLFDRKWIPIDEARKILRVIESEFEFWKGSGLPRTRLNAKGEEFVNAQDIELILKYEADIAEAPGKVEQIAKSMEKDFSDKVLSSAAKKASSTGSSSFVSSSWGAKLSAKSGWSGATTSYARSTEWTKRLIRASESRQQFLDRLNQDIVTNLPPHLAFLNGKTRAEVGAWLERNEKETLTQDKLTSRLRGQAQKRLSATFDYLDEREEEKQREALFESGQRAQGRKRANKVREDAKKLAAGVTAEADRLAAEEFDRMDAMEESSAAEAKFSSKNRRRARRRISALKKAESDRLDALDKEKELNDKTAAANREQAQHRIKEMKAKGRIARIVGMDPDKLDTKLLSIFGGDKEAMEGLKSLVGGGRPTAQAVRRIISSLAEQHKEVGSAAKGVIFAQTMRLMGGPKLIAQGLGGIGGGKLGSTIGGMFGKAELGEGIGAALGGSLFPKLLGPAAALGVGAIRTFTNARENNQARMSSMGVFSPEVNLAQAQRQVLDLDIQRRRAGVLGAGSASLEKAFQGFDSGKANFGIELERFWQNTVQPIVEFFLSVGRWILEGGAWLLDKVNDFLDTWYSFLDNIFEVLADILDHLPFTEGLTKSMRTWYDAHNQKDNQEGLELDLAGLLLGDKADRNMNPVPAPIAVQQLLPGLDNPVAIDALRAAGRMVNNFHPRVGLGGVMEF